MTASSDSGDGHRSVKKNGHDQTQDRAIRELHDEFITHISDEDKHHALVERSMDAIGAKFDKYLFGARVAWAFVALLAALVGAYQVSLDHRTDIAEERLDVLTAKQHAFEERGTKWGQDLDRQVYEAKEDIREIRKIVREHHMTKRPGSRE